jgi:hypothetical protein
LNKYLLTGILLVLVLVVSIPVQAATTNAATVNATCVILSGVAVGTEQVYFDYGHTTNPDFSSSTPNKSYSGTFTAVRCDEPTFLPGNTYKYRACGMTSGCGATVTFSMNALIPHETTTLSQYGETFIAQGGDIKWVAMHVWDIYSMVWGSYFLLLLIAFVFMNIVIKQKSITVAFLLMLISAGVLLSIAPPETTQIAEILMAIALTGLVFWLYKGKR